MAFITRYCRIQHQAIFDADILLYEQTAKNLDGFLDEALKALSITYPKYYKMDRLSKLGFLGAEILLRGTSVLEAYGPEGTALVISNTNASLDTDVRYFETARTIASPALFVYTLTNIVTGEICIRHGIKGENAFFVTPQFDPILLAGYVESILKTGKTNACIAGWVDVMGEQHDVFLYLVEKGAGQPNAMAHSPEQLKKLYVG